MSTQQPGAPEQVGAVPVQVPVRVVPPHVRLSAPPLRAKPEKQTVVAVLLKACALEYVQAAALATAVKTGHVMAEIHTSTHSTSALWTKTTQAKAHVTVHTPAWRT